MKILLLYPKPVEGINQRETRLDHQLDCIAKLVRGLLSEADIEQHFSVREIAYEASESEQFSRNAASEIFNGKSIQDFNVTDLISLYDRSDLVIEISGEKCTQAEFYDYKGASIIIRPTYPGSFAQNDIDIECRNMEDKAWITEKVIEAKRMAEQTASLSEYVEPDMHYSQFAPLPYRLGKEFYEVKRDHALVFLSYGSGENTDQICKQDQETIALLLHDMEQLASLTIVTDTLSTQPRAKQIANAITESLGLETKVFSHRRGDYRDLFSVLAKCDVALFAGNSLYVDSIRLGVPAYIWRSKQTGVEPLNTAFQSLLDGSDLIGVIDEQKQQLERLIQSHYLGHTLPNDRRVLLESLSTIISKIAPGIMVDAESLIKNPMVPEPIIDQPPVWHTQSLSSQIRLRVSNSRRKLTKFKQSPERFFQDSEHPLAKKIYTLIK